MAGHAWIPNPGKQALLARLHYAFPIIIFVLFAAAFMAQSIISAPKDSKLEAAKGLHGPGGKPLPKTKKRGPSAQREVLKDDFSPAKKAVFNWISAAVVLSFIASAAAAIAHALVERNGTQWWCGEHVAVYSVGSVTIFALVLVSLIDSAPSPTWAHALTWSVALFMELILLGNSVALYSGPHREPSAQDRIDPKTRTMIYHGNILDTMNSWDALEVSIDLTRVLLLIGLLIFWTFFSWQRAKDIQARQAAEHDPEERTSLLNGHTTKRHDGREYGAISNGNANGYANGNCTSHSSDEDHQEDGWKRPEKIPSRSWYEYLRGYSLFLPYLWPSRSRKLKFTVLVCLILVVIQRVINILVPKYTGRLVDEFTTGDDGSRIIPWQTIGLYVFFRALQGNQGLIGALRTILWIPVSQYSYRELSTAAFEHVHSLSLDFHLAKRTGEVVSALNKGGSINNFLESLTFNLLPMLIDLVLAIYVFLVQYDAYYALVLFIMAVVYLYLTVRMTQWRSDKRREMVKLDREEEAVKTDSLSGYESVKYFNAEAHEFKKYRDAVKAYQKAEYAVLFYLQALNVSQMAVFAIALLVISFVAAYQVVAGDLSPGDFVMLITYVTQLQAPFSYFGQFYRSIQSSMINAERLLELFKEQPTVVDDPDAQELTDCRGEIQCNDIEFAYDSRHPALKGVTFRCAPGTTTALVGESGGGKSTLFRLLFRFYDLTGGNIEIDGQDVRNLTMDSIRQHIGVVPQDTILFNDTIMYNLKYANPNATDEDVYAAAKAACIHDKILGFPDGYESLVGERGLKLSGGERQRVAIARAIIKNPRIILLDEATAALDSDTEQNIQEALEILSENRTTLVIAHRLSTITMADQILVLQDGRIVEAGPHDELLERNGRYATMWRKQMRAQRVAEEARYLTNKARRLREEVDDSASASQSEDERSGSSTAKDIADNRGHGKHSSLAMAARDTKSRDGDSLDQE